MHFFLGALRVKSFWDSPFFPKLLVENVKVKDHKPIQWYRQPRASKKTIIVKQPAIASKAIMNPPLIRISHITIVIIS